MSQMTDYEKFILKFSKWESPNYPTKLLINLRPNGSFDPSVVLVYVGKENTGRLCEVYRNSPVAEPWRVTQAKNGWIELHLSYLWGLYSGNSVRWIRQGGHTRGARATMSDEQFMRYAVTEVNGGAVAMELTAGY